MTVSIPSPIDAHTDYNSNVATFGSPTNTGNKANGGVPLNTTGAQWYGKTTTGGAGYIWAFSGTQNFQTTDEIYIIAHQYNAPNRVSCGTVANEGLNVRMYTGTTTNYRLFVVGGQDTDMGKFRRSPTPVVIDPQAPGDRDSGSYNSASVQRYGFGVYYSVFAGGSTNWNYVTKSVLVGTTQTSAKTPRLYGTGVKLKDLHAAVFGITGWASTMHVYTLAAGDTYTYLCPFVIGYDSQGSTQTTFDDEGITVVSPANKVSTDPRFHLTTNAMRVHLDLRNNAADTATFSGTYIWGTEAPFNFNQSDAAVVTFNGPTFKNMGDFTVGSSISGNATWDGAGVVIKNTSADLDGSTFRNPNNNHLLRVNGAQTLEGMTFDNYSTDVAIEIMAGGTYTLDNVYFDKSGSYEIEIDSGVSTPVTIILTNGTTALAGGDIDNNGSSTVSIQNNVTVAVTVKNAADVEIQNARVLLEVTSGGDLPYGESVTIVRSGSTATVTHTSHGLATNNKVNIQGANQPEYNGVHQITVTGASTYTYTVSGSPATPATGTITSTYVVIEGLTDVNGEIEVQHNFTSDQGFAGWARKSSASPFYKTSNMSGAIVSSGFTATMILGSDE